jgi:DNA-binding transcriptional MocR family regulator
MPHRQSASKRTYDQLKVAILEGELPAGRLDIQRLADRLRVSLTPVREALARLATERLIDFGARGFSISTPSADTLQDLYGWSGQIVQLSLDDVREAVVLNPSDVERLPWRSGGTKETQYARGVSVLFYEVAMSQPSREIAEQVTQANNRLFQARRCEPLLLPEADGELQELTLLWRASDLMRFRDSVHSYHSKRIGDVARIASELARRTEARLFST